MKFSVLAVGLVLAVTVQQTNAHGNCAVEKLKKNTDLECTSSGDYKRKQCGDDGKCFCVSKKTGERRFPNITVPSNHDFKCRGRLRSCYRKELKLLMDVSPTGEVPELPRCNRRGNYEPKQCTTLRGRNKCRNRQKREIACDSPSEFGTGSAAYSEKLDQIDRWTMVDNQAVTLTGEIHEVDVYAGATGRPLRIGVYQQLGDRACQFSLEHQVEIDSLPLGFSRVALEDRLPIKSGQYIGISWTNKGVVAFNTSEDDLYCEAARTFEVGDAVTLNEDRFGFRDYSIVFRITEPAHYVGYSPTPRPTVDHAVQWTFVDISSPFPVDGKISGVELYVDEDRGGKNLTVGVYSRTASPCTFTVKELVELVNLTAGYNRVDLDIVTVKGDYVGIKWEDSGVVTHEPATVINYCQSSADYEVDDTVTFNTYNPNVGRRIYSFRALYESCDTGGLGARSGVTCEECYCVTKKGREIDGTRTTGDLNCDDL